MTTDDQKRIRIAEFCGWGSLHTFPAYPGYVKGTKPGRATVIPDLADSDETCVVPDYLNSLDAIAQVEARLTDEQWPMYEIHLSCITGVDNKEYNWTDRSRTRRAVHSATARQRAEAILKIIP
jgi:hypothetical protein